MGDIAEEDEASYAEWLANNMSLPPAVRIAVKKCKVVDDIKDWKQENDLDHSQIKVTIWFEAEGEKEVVVSADDCLEFMRK